MKIPRIQKDQVDNKKKRMKAWARKEPIQRKIKGRKKVTKKK